ncbi:MAG: indole-3-glycerol phosphate synthase TrpC, partial [Trueperaceae bacterium]
PTARLALVPGVLGRIARERANDYADAAAPAPPTGDAATPPGRFEDALRGPGLSFVTEIKRGSPSQGAIADLDPVRAAHAYAEGGAAALSVLTEPRHFGGDLAHLRTVARACPLPAMRKEFVVHPAQVAEAAEAGAAAVLLIVAVLEDATGAYLRYAHALGLDALIEVHDQRELDLALNIGARIVGVNNRDLRTLDVDLRTAPRLIQAARDAGFAGACVAESGYAIANDLREVLPLADAVLIGTSLAGSGDLTGALRTVRRDVGALHPAT